MWRNDALAAPPSSGCGDSTEFNVYYIDECKTRSLELLHILGETYGTKRTTLQKIQTMKWINHQPISH